jgi:autophagy-related protein 9
MWINFQKSGQHFSCGRLIAPGSLTELIRPRFVAFIAGSLSAVLLAATLLDPDLFLHFEITPHRTVLFYLGIFGGILAMARGMVPEENLVFDPEASLKEVVKWTHYLPGEWKGKLHSQMVSYAICFL